MIRPCSLLGGHAVEYMLGIEAGQMMGEDSPERAKDSNKEDHST